MANPPYGGMDVLHLDLRLQFANGKNHRQEQQHWRTTLQQRCDTFASTIVNQLAAIKPSVGVLSLCSQPDGQVISFSDPLGLDKIQDVEHSGCQCVHRLLGRCLRKLTTLAPDIVDAILLNELPNHLTLFDLAVDPPLCWGKQRARLALS